MAADEAWARTIERSVGEMRTLLDAIAEELRAIRRRVHTLESSDAAAKAAEAALAAQRANLRRHISAMVAGAGVAWAIVSPFLLR